MKQTQEGKKIDSQIICSRCHKKIITAKIVGLSLICPFCGKPSEELSTESNIN